MSGWPLTPSKVIDQPQSTTTWNPQALTSVQLLKEVPPPTNWSQLWQALNSNQLRSEERLLDDLNQNRMLGHSKRQKHN